MKKSNKYILIGITSLILICPFLISITKAQEWPYDGADTSIIPDFSVYPSEWYVYNITGLLPPNHLLIAEILKGNITDLGLGNGTCVWGNFWTWNLTSGEKINTMPDTLYAFWNETYYGSQNIPFIIPVEDNGILSLPIMSNVSDFFENALMSTVIWENKQVFPNIYSFAYWNTSNGAYFHFNYTDDGILSQWEPHLISGGGNLTLHSQPAQLPPVFSFSTDDDILTINSTNFKIATTITDADNNNDGVTDTDYLFRVLNGSTWTDWAAPTSLLDLDLGSVATGNYTVTMEVKNMYGVTQEQITIEYIPPAVVNDGGFVSGYPIFIVSMVAILGIIVITYRNRKKLKI